jgi:hypothetical protein
MPANSSRFNRFLVLLLVQFTTFPLAYGQLPQLNHQQLDWLGQQIFANECSSRHQCLTSWNPGEDFPSLGIGHFIWYQAQQTEPFEETFPALIAFYNERSVPIPRWLQANPDAPWPDRQSFLTELDSPELEQLRQFLATTMEFQVEFISRRLYTTIDAIVARFPESQQPAIETGFIELANSHPPLGLYALIDYLHFKGSGLQPGEAYQGQGWGLLQVWQQMQGQPVGLEQFVTAASSILATRVANAPAERNEQRWLQGWINRLQTYLPATEQTTQR